MFSLDDYRALQTRAGVVRRTDRGVLRVTGRDRATWLQGLVTNDILALSDGQACYAAWLTPQGRMITDMHIASVGESLLVDVPAPLAASLRERLDSLIFAEDAQVEDVSASVAVWGVYGPESGRASGGAPPIPDPGFGVPGFTLYLDSERGLPEALAGLPEAGLDTLDVLRIEAGTPKFLVDMGADTIPLEAGIEDRAISFTKGCYVGQEVIVRVTHRGGGRVAKKLVRLDIAADGATPSTVPDPGSRIASGDRDIGRITSAAFSPNRGHIVALGYVHRDFVTPGTELSVAGRQAHLNSAL